MNLAAASSTDPTLHLPPQPPQHSSTACARHPEEHFTGFCPSCLCERLAVLDQNSSAASSSRKPPTSTAAAALRAIFKPPSVSAAAPSFLPELRRTKSFSASKNTGEGYFSGAFEPQRKSCDVRGRNTLWNLFSQDDERNPGRREQKQSLPASAVPLADAVESGRPSLSSCPVIEACKSEEEEDEGEEAEEEIRVCLDTNNVGNLIEERVQEIVEEEEEKEVEEFIELMKPMKEHIDLDSQAKKRDLKEIAGSFWSAASVFSKKLQKWRHKQKLKKRQSGSGGGVSATLPVEKPIGRQFRETQSEIADYGFGRRSCDTDPRFSLDAGRMSLDAGRISFDDPRYSFDEPRASWDGYLIGRTFPRMPTMLSVVEDAPVVHVARSDAHIPVEEDPPSVNLGSSEAGAGAGADEAIPGGSLQTRDYYTDSSRRPRRSLDRSNSIRKTAQAVVAEIDEMKSAAAATAPTSNAKVTPATVGEFITGRDAPYPTFTKSNSVRDDCSDINGGSNPGKKSRRWSWNIWALIHRRGPKGEYSNGRDNGVARSLSETFGERNAGFGYNPKVVRSNSSVSWRNSSIRHSNSSAEGNGARKKDEPFVLERNRSARYSPGSMENGLFRFYWTPGGRRSEKGRYNQAHSVARSVLRLY